MEVLKTDEIDKAYKRIQSLVVKTPLITNETINKITNSKVYFKLENLQKTGSFKIRGASNIISKLSDKEKSKGIISYSSGNHAQAVAYVSNYFGISATIVMPKNAPKIKIENTKKYGAKIILYDPSYENREKIALEISLKEGKKIIKPYDDFDIIAGQGTAGKEIVEQLKIENIKPDFYLCCCGGGGLIAGTATYLKFFYPDIRIYSVEPNDFNDTQLSLLQNCIVKNNNSAKSICDALLVNKPGEITFSINKKILDGGLSVSDLEVKDTIIELAENLKTIIEPGGAVAASALLNNKLKFENKNVVVMVSGGNIDYSLFSNIIKEKK